MLRERLLEAFKEIGFDEYKEIQSCDVVFSKDVFDQCAMNTCGHFGKNHGCPPLAGGEEEGKARVLKYKNGFLLCKIVSIISRKGIEESIELVANINNELQKTQYSMEGSGIDVVRMAIDHKMTYNAGRGKVGYFTLVLYNA